LYAIVKTGGKQYRVEQGQSLLVERLPVKSGETLSLEPLLYVDGATVVDGADLHKVAVQARVVAHERGPKLRVVKFKPKRGYKRRNGHRQELTRIEITTLKISGRRGKAPAREAPKPVAAQPRAQEAEEPKVPDSPAPVAEERIEAASGGEARAEAGEVGVTAAETEAEPTDEPAEAEAGDAVPTDEPEEAENGA
jgi:large subunit ribosomal protein L21